MAPSFSRREVLAGALGAIAVPAPLAALATSAPAAGFEVTHTALEVPGLDPAHDGLLVAHLTDVHVGWETPDARLRAAVETANLVRPDLVVLTGDFVTFSRGPLPHVPEMLHGIEAPTFACLGNHDHLVDARGVRRALEGQGYTVLQNANTVTRVRGAPLTIVGIDDGHTRHDDVAGSLRGVSPRGSKLVLTHEPPTAEKLPRGAGLLCLAGHTHGGGIMVPAITPAIAWVFGQRYMRGLFRVGGNALYVNRGIGCGNATSPRIGSEPELALFTLRCAAA